MCKGSAHVDTSTLFATAKPGKPKRQVGNEEREAVAHVIHPLASQAFHALLQPLLWDLRTGPETSLLCGISQESWGFWGVVFDSLTQ